MKPQTPSLSQPRPDGEPSAVPARGTGHSPPPGIARIGLFEGLEGAEIARIFSRSRLIAYGKDDIALAEGSEPAALFFVVSGAFTCRKASANGILFTLAHLRAGDLFGENALTGRPWGVEVTALEASQVCAVPAGDFRAALERHPSISRRLIDVMAERISELATLSFEAATMKLDTRLRRTIQKLARERNQLRDGGIIRPAPTHAELASMLGTTREVISRSMTSLSRQGMIETRRQEIHIRSAEALDCLGG